MFVRQVYAAAATVGDLTVTGALAVTGASTLTGDIAAGNVNMASGKIVTLAAGTQAAPSLRFAGSNAGTGLSAETADQVILGRSGSQGMVLNGNGLIAVTALNTSGSLIVAGAFRPTATSSTIDYTSLTTDRTIMMNVTAGGTLTLVASPLTGQTYFIFNESANALTIARQGSHLINGATSVSVAAGAGCVAHYVTTNDWRVMEAPAA